MSDWAMFGTLAVVVFVFGAVVGAIVMQDAARTKPPKPFDSDYLRDPYGDQ